MTSAAFDALLDSGVTQKCDHLSGRSVSCTGICSLYRRGVRVPDDVAMTGYEDEGTARFHSPLTSVRQSYPRMGERAVKLLMQLIDGSQLPAP
ncbi:substrate-binding domain-containing protein [Branchiibius sp. NY16-3462-2]|uniref:substrate-binding domain-containing protein n=1 Tax=Branchiibius sp. NY16-3462-2 TaxID=1807500 RepID=UPI00345DB08D